MIDSTFFTYFWQADVVVKTVLFLLIGASIISWVTIFQRRQYIKQVQEATEKFEQEFLACTDLSKLYVDSLKQSPHAQGLEAIFRAGVKECMRLRNHVQTPTPEAMMESAKRAMRSAQMREQDQLEMQLPVLATVGSISPYVGLFGTVWGIMISFRSLAQVQQATIAMVAPGIAEALIATAIGLFAAIPAVIAYNRYATSIARLLNQFDAFHEDFANILYRYAQQTVSPESAES